MTPRPKVVAILTPVREAYPWLKGIMFAVPGLIFEDEASGLRLIVRGDGGVEEIGTVPARKSAASDPTSVRGSRA